MKEGIGGTQIFLIFIVLILLFASIMAFTINHSNAFSVKTQLVTVLEDAGGLDLSVELNPGEAEYSYAENVDKQTLASIVDIINFNSYRATGSCDVLEKEIGSVRNPDVEIQGYQRDGRSASSNEKASFCIAKISSKNGDSGANQAYYYQIIVFYSLDIPIVNELLNLKLVGETKPLYR